MHRKERAIAPILEREIGLQVIVPDNFDTDRFGTFTRDIKRLGTQIETARAKAIEAIELTGKEIGIASEGSFYPYPEFPLVTCNREIVLLLDRANDLEIIGQTISTDTNHAGMEIATVEEALSFAGKVGFPEHGLVLMLSAEPGSDEEIFKGITAEKELITVVERILTKHGKAHLETDMRALYNPTRMKAIEQATEDLVRKLTRLCPSCSRPGFDSIERRPGLPCALCHLPTPLIRLEILGCHHCGYRQENPFPDGRETADPMYCEYCNP